MKADEFLVLATRLSAHSGEAEKRSAVSRAYYALFHSARLLIEACDVACPESAEAHDKISKCLRNSQDQSLMAAGDKLSTFRTTRNQADYRLGDPRFADAQFIVFQLAASLFEFLCLGSRKGYFSLGSLPHNVDGTLREYLGPDGDLPVAHFLSADYQTKVIAYLSERLDLKPWPRSHFDELQTRYAGLLHYPPM